MAFDSNASARCAARAAESRGEASAAPRQQWPSDAHHARLTSAMPTQATTAKGVQFVRALRKKPPDARIAPLRSYAAEW
eukprot:6327450-Prymnesium_polylepis.1